LAKPITRLPQTECAGKKLHNGFLWGFLRASEDPIRALNNHAKRFALIGHNPTGTNAWENIAKSSLTISAKPVGVWGAASQRAGCAR
jgi:hypothetical protein